MTFVPAYTPIDDLDQFDSNRLPFLRIQSNSPAVAEDRPNVEIKIQKQFATSTIHANSIGVHEQPDHWLWETAESLGTLLTLEDNWDSYGAKSVSPETILATFELLIAIMDDHSPRASIVPTPMGNVQIEWHRSGIDLEIEITADGKYSVLYDDHAKSTEFYEDNSFQRTIHNPSQLIDFVEHITKRAENDGAAAKTGVQERHRSIGPLSESAPTGWSDIV